MLTWEKNGAVRGEMMEEGSSTLAGMKTGVIRRQDTGGGTDGHSRRFGVISGRRMKMAMASKDRS